MTSRPNKPAHAHNPPNISGNKKGYNTLLYPNHRAIRKALRHLGYQLSPTNSKPPSIIVRQFQKHYNFCSISRFHKWGGLKIDGKAGKHTLNALEIALKWATKRGTAKGKSPAHVWRHTCNRSRPGKGKFPGMPHGKPHGKPPKKKQPEFVEIRGKNIGKLRRPGMDYRVFVKQLARKGDMLFAKVTIPPQLGLPSGKHGAKWYPAIFKPMGGHPKAL